MYIFCFVMLILRVCVCIYKHTLILFEHYQYVCIHTEGEQQIISF